MVVVDNVIRAFHHEPSGVCERTLPSELQVKLTSHIFGEKNDVLASAF